MYENNVAIEVSELAYQLRAWEGQEVWLAYQLRAWEGQEVWQSVTSIDQQKLYRTIMDKC